jgi:hypothetical protein
MRIRSLCAAPHLPRRRAAGAGGNGDENALYAVDVTSVLRKDHVSHP